MATWWTKRTLHGALRSGLTKGGKDEIAGEQPCVQAAVATADEGQPNVPEVGEQAPYVSRRKHVQVCGVVFGSTTEEKAKPSL